MRRYLRGISVVILLWVLLFSNGESVSALQGQSMYWEHYDVGITINPDGTFWVIENNVLNFTQGPFRSGFAVIPTDRVDEITNISVTGDGEVYRRSTSGRPKTFNVIDGGNELEIEWFFAPTSGVHSYQVKYLVHGGLRYYKDGDQLWWEAVSDERDAPVRYSTVIVRLPQGVNVTELATEEGSARATWGAQVGRDVTFNAVGTIPAGVPLIVRVQFPHGKVKGAATSWQVIGDLNQDDALSWALVVGALLILLIGGVLQLVLWYNKGRAPEVPLPAEMIKNLPRNDPPAVAAFLVSDISDMLTLMMATVVDLARRGYLVLEEEGPRPGSSFGTLVFRNIGKSSAGLEEFEAWLYNFLFLGGDEQRLINLQERFYLRTNEFRERLLLSMSRRQYLSVDNPGKAQLQAMILPGVLTVAAFIFSCLSTQWAFRYNMLTLLCPFWALAAATGFALLRVMATSYRTREGVEAAALWRSFLHYLKNAENFSDLQAATDLFEKYLPYSIAFGFQQAWIDKFTALPPSVVVPAPHWYRQPGMQHSGMGASSSGSGMGGGGGMAMPSLQQASNGMAGGLQSMSNSLSNALNMAAQTISSRPASTSYRSSGYRSSGSGSRRSSGSSHRRSGFSGGGSRGGSGGGGRRGFR